MTLKSYKSLIFKQKGEVNECGGGGTHTQANAPALTLVQNACQASAMTNNSISD